MSSDPAIDFTFRYKDEASMERNWQRDNTNISLYNVFNDILGLRFVLPIKKDQLELIATDFINACPTGEITCRLNPLNRYGYQGLHLYIRANTKTFPVEIQFWTRTDALLNQYLIPKASFGVIGAKDISTLKRTHRTFGPCKVIKSVDEFIQDIVSN